MTNEDGISKDMDDELAQIDAMIAAQEKLAGYVPQSTIDQVLKDLRERRDRITSSQTPSQSGSSVSIQSKENLSIGGDVIGRDSIVANISVYQDTKPVAKVQDDTELQYRYLNYLIAAHRHLPLQGIRAGSQPLSVELERVYVSLTTLDQYSQTHTGVGPSNPDLSRESHISSSKVLSIPIALQKNRKLVIVGDPGCGKTTLLSYLALTYARALQGERTLVADRLGTDEFLAFPILLPLRELGALISSSERHKISIGPGLLLEYLVTHYQAQKIPVTDEFFEKRLSGGRAVVLLDGMDEVADPLARQRMARLIEKVTARYPDNRYVVTSRESGYSGSSRLGAGFGLVRIRDFSFDEIKRFVRDWSRAVEITLAGENTEQVIALAETKARKLIEAIETNHRISDLAVNPLLLTVVALVHRYRAQLPERRSELYEEAIEVLLGQWDEAKGINNELPFQGRTLDAGDRRSMLEPVALWLHDRERREIELDELRSILTPAFLGNTGGALPEAEKALSVFLRLICERSGLLVERGVGVFGFAHLTFQEYLAARAIADKPDFIEYAVNNLGIAWWRESIMLLAGYLSTQGKRRVSDLIRAIIQAKPAISDRPHENLVLAAESLFDVGPARVDSDLLGEVKSRLQVISAPPVGEERMLISRPRLLERIAATNALARIESGQIQALSRHWAQPWGEPGWVDVPAASLHMRGRNGQDYNVDLSAFRISRTLITVAQFQIYQNYQKHKSASQWLLSDPAAGREEHPVTEVSWTSAMKYCDWLSTKIGVRVRLPTEAEWVYAAFGQGKGKLYPWGDNWIDLLANTSELGLVGTTPVGFFLGGASHFGCYDMAGNVWEWTATETRDFSEATERKSKRIIRGGGFDYDASYASRDYRYAFPVEYVAGDLGFRVVMEHPR